MDRLRIRSLCRQVNRGIEGARVDVYASLSFEALKKRRNGHNDNKNMVTIRLHWEGGGFEFSPKRRV